MKNQTYHSGEKPTVGDVVTVSKNNTLAYYSPLKSNYTRKYKVTNVVPGIKSLLVGIENFDKNGPMYIDSLLYKASHFNLTKKAGNEMTSNKEVPKILIVDQNGKVVKTLSTDDQDKMATFLKNELLRSPVSRFHIFEYRTTAKTQEPIVEFESELKQESSVDKSLNEIYFRKM